MALSNEDYSGLLQALELGNAKLEKVLERYYESGDDTAIRSLARQDIINICDDILNAGDWEHSAFLRQVITPVVETRQSMLDAKVAEIEGKRAAEAEVCSSVSGMQEVFIALYQADGHNIAQWELILRSLPRFMLGRPVYATEDCVIAFVKSKEDRSSEAYAKVLVNPNAIIDDTGAVRCDRIGQELLNISQGSLLVENIRSFHHMGTSYKFNGKDLVQV